MFKVPISELFLFSYLNLNITLRTSVKKFFDLHKTRIFYEFYKTFKFAAILAHALVSSRSSKSCDVDSGTRDFSLSLDLTGNKSRYFCKFLENAGKMCCSEMWKHQRRSEWNKHAQDSFLWHHMPAKTEEAKEMDPFYAGGEEDVDTRLERPRPCARCTSMTRISRG